MMIKKTQQRNLRHLLLVSLTWIFSSCASAPAEKWYDFSRPCMGVDFRLLLRSDDPERAVLAAEAAFARIAQINQACSDYLDGSELRRLCAAEVGKPHRLSEDLWQVLSYAQQLSEDSKGAFDVTAGPYILQWRLARHRRQAPPPAIMRSLKAKVGYQKLRLDEKSRSAVLAVEGMRLDLGGLAKGYAADEALKALLRCGVVYALVDGSGDMAMTEHPQSGWPVRISDGQRHGEFVHFKGRALATSGDLLQSVLIDGRRYSHIIDPRSGQGVVGSRRVTVSAPTAMQADALASAASVLSPQEALSLVEKMSEVELEVLTADSKLYQTENFLKILNKE
jgi:thiamine biosynthesis lipoprotein